MYSEIINTIKEALSTHNWVEMHILAEDNQHKVMIVGEFFTHSGILFKDVNDAIIDKLTKQFAHCEQEPTSGSRYYKIKEEDIDVA